MWQNSVLKSFGYELFFFALENFNICTSIKLKVIGSFKLLTWPSFNFGKWYVLRKLLISLTFSNLVHQRILNSILRIPWSSLVSVFLSPFSFMILEIFIFSLPLIWMRNKKNPHDFLKGPNLCFIGLCLFLFY